MWAECFPTMPLLSGNVCNKVEKDGVFELLWVFSSCTYTHSRSFLFRLNPFLFVQSAPSTCESPKPCFYPPPPPGPSSVSLPKCPSVSQRLLSPEQPVGEQSQEFHAVLFFSEQMWKKSTTREMRRLSLSGVCCMYPPWPISSMIFFFHFKRMWKSPYWETVNI